MVKKKIVKPKNKPVVEKPAENPQKIVIEAKEEIEKKIENDEINHSIKIKVFGVGGGGCSIVGQIATIIPRGKNVSFCAINTDIQSFAGLPSSVKTLALGKAVTHGLGCGMNAKLGEEIGELSKEILKKELEACDICFIISTLGGGTGSGITPAFAQIAKNLRKISMGIFTLPFEFEGDKRKQIAYTALEKIEPELNASIVIPNENIFQVIDPKTPIKQSFSMVNQNLITTLHGLLETLYQPGLINVDYADFKTILEGVGRVAYLNCVEGERKDLIQLINKLLNNQLVKYNIGEDGTRDAIDIEKILFNIAGPTDLKMSEMENIANSITSENLKSKIIFGITSQGGKTSSLRVTLLAVGVKKQGGKPRIFKRIEEMVPREEIKIKDVPVQSEIMESKKEKEPERKEEKPKAKPEKKVDKKSMVRRNAIEVKKEEKKQEQEIMEEDEKWDIPAFLRIKK